MRRSTRIALSVAWPVDVLTVVLGWRGVSAAPMGTSTGFVATACGFYGYCC